MPLSSSSLLAAAVGAALLAMACGTQGGGAAAAGGSAAAAGGSAAGGSAAGGSAGMAAGASGGGGGSAGLNAGGAADDPDPELTADERSALEGLRYDSGPQPEDPSNRVFDDADAVSFGQRLFFDASFSGPLIERDNDGSASALGRAGEAGRVSCAGCHVPQAGFVDVRSPHQQISLGAQWTKRRSPTLLDVASMPLFNWDGRRDSLWAQAIGVMESSSEFNSGRLFVAQQAFRLHRSEYEAIFGAMPALDDAQRFPQLQPLQAGCEPGPVETAPCRGKPGDGADYDGMAADAQQAVTTVTVNVAKAISAYLHELRCGPSRFESWLDGDVEALNRQEQRGAALFVGKAGCVKCHSGPTLSDGQFHNVGLRPATVAVAFTDTDDRGAGEGLPLALTDPLNSDGAFSDGSRGVLPAAAGAELEGAFRTPTLRCIAKQPSFMHTAQYQSLALVVKFFNRGGDPAGYPGTNELSPLGLSDREQADLVAFLGALQGDGPAVELLAPPAD